MVNDAEMTQYGVFKKALKPKKLMKTLTKWQKALTWNAVYFENHDQPRCISRLVGSEDHLDKASKMMAGLTMTLRGTPFVYEGQEIGMTNGDFKNMQEVVDIESHNIYKMATNLRLPKKMRWNMIKRTSRDNARTPMQWTAGKNAGFSENTPWLKINANHQSINVETEQQKPDGVLAFWKQMIALRKEHPLLREGGFEAIYEGKSIYAFERALDGKKLLCLFNMCAKSKKLPKNLWGGNVIADNYSNDERDINELKPFEFRLVKLYEGE